MQTLELNLDRIRALSRQREEENWRFRVFLKGKDGEQIDEIVHEINNTISKQIDCKKCGNCCKKLQPLVTDEEILFLSKKTNLPVDEFKKEFLEKDEEDKTTMYLKDIPCTFLDDKLCSIYNDRPENCRTYPHLHKPNFTQRSFFFLDQYEICPIVFNLMEQLKDSLHFKR